ncbi:MAG: hypothetical protein KDB27_13880, partial [Planctomycetales bacterium]|nr:hypothetical protein [Planctomycetales bacterium]
IDPHDAHQELDSLRFGECDNTIWWRATNSCLLNASEPFTIDVYARSAKQDDAWQLVYSTSDPNRLIKSEDGEIGIALPGICPSASFRNIQVRVSHCSGGRVLTPLRATIERDATDSVPRLISPAMNQTYRRGETVLLLGYGVVDGARTDDIRWQVKRYGKVLSEHKGPQVALRKLDPGDYSVSVAVDGSTDVCEHEFFIQS